MLQFTGKNTLKLPFDYNFKYEIVLGPLIAAEGGIIFVGRDEVKKLVLKVDYHVTEKTRGG